MASNEKLAAMNYAASGLAELAGGWASYQVGNAHAGYQRTAAANNRAFAKLRADDVRAQGDKAAGQHLKKVGRMVGSQRAALAAQGIDVNSGSAADIQADTVTQGRIDANQIKTNTWMDAWGIEANADNENATATMGADAMQFDAATSLALGGMRAIGQGMQAYRALDTKAGSR